MNLLFYIISLNLISCIFNLSDNKIIISLKSDINSIQNTILVINSIIQQNVDPNYYEILIILSSIEFKNKDELPNEIKSLYELKKIKILFIKRNLTNKSSALITLKRYKNNDVLIINNKCLLPNGWLKMFIQDHYKYPNDAIAATIQYHFGKNLEVKEFSVGYKGEKYGTFNHISDMIFNFALINIDLGGILYPKNFFKSFSFYNEKLFLKAANNSDDFWQSAFIIMENKNLRQSSKIFDYTKYLIDNINYIDYYNYKKDLLTNTKKLFSLSFPFFEDSIKRRQNKIIVSLTSYPKRFNFLLGLINFIKNQSHHINKIILFLYEEDKKYYNLNIKEFEVISVKRNLKPHLKYFYAMKKYRNYAVITIDDDVGYTKDTFQSLFNEYIENPNLISGRRGHLMTYKKNGELKKYSKWIYQQRLIKEPSFDLTLTNVGSTIFPPDILNIKDDYLPIIYETITCDDLTLKYFSILKGIQHKWIVNDRLMGHKRNLPKTDAKPLYKINYVNNDICLNKLNILINKTIVNNLCVEYGNLHTGASIYLFDIHNKKQINNKLFFDINAYSHCPIDQKLIFNITFDKSIFFCFFNESKNFIYNNNSMIASCYSNEKEYYLDYYFPKANTKNNIFINIYNYRKYLTFIYRSFICQEINNCILKVITFESFPNQNLTINFNNINYFCLLDDFSFLMNNLFPKIIQFKCTISENDENISNIFVSGIHYTLGNNIKPINDSTIPTLFIISRIVINRKEEKIIIIGNLVNDLKRDLNNLLINFIYPNSTFDCDLKSNTKYVQSKIYCINHNNWKNQIIVENQIAYSTIDNEELLLINKETIIKLDFNKKNKDDYLLFSNTTNKFSTISILFIFIFIKIIFLIFFSFDNYQNECMFYNRLSILNYLNKKTF